MLVLKFSHTGNPIPWKVKNKLSVMWAQNQKLLSIAEPESEISYAYKTHIAQLYSSKAPG